MSSSRSKKVTDQIPDKVKQTATEEAARIRSLAEEGVRSKAYLYPFRGIFYFLTHRSLHKALTSRLIPTLTMGTAITAAMFLFTYLPQAAALTFVNGPIAPLSTILLVLSESSTLLNFASRAWWLNDALLDTFDGVLVAKQLDSLVSAGREVKRGNDPMHKLGKLVKKPFAAWSPSAIIRYLMYLPLNMIPVVGTVLFVILQGKKYGPLAHDRYFQLKGWGPKKSEEFVEAQKGAYTGFGVPCVMLEMVPVVGILFAFTNATGAALWAADMEAAGSTAPELRDQASKAK